MSSYHLVSDMMTMMMMKSSGAWITARGQKASAVRSLSTILPFADCGTSLHPNSETARRLLSLHCSDSRFFPIVEVMVRQVSAFSSFWRLNLRNCAGFSGVDVLARFSPHF